MGRNGCERTIFFIICFLPGGSHLASLENVATELGECDLLRVATAATAHRLVTDERSREECRREGRRLHLLRRLPSTSFRRAPAPRAAAAVATAGTRGAGCGLRRCSTLRSALPALGRFAALGRVAALGRFAPLGDFAALSPFEESAESFGDLVAT